MQNCSNFAFAWQACGQDQHAEEERNVLIVS